MQVGLLLKISMRSFKNSFQGQIPKNPQESHCVPFVAEQCFVALDNTLKLKEDVKMQVDLPQTIQKKLVFVKYFHAMPRHTKEWHISNAYDIHIHKPL